MPHTLLLRSRVEAAAAAAAWVAVNDKLCQPWMKERLLSQLLLETVEGYCSERGALGTMLQSQSDSLSRLVKQTLLAALRTTAFLVGTLSNGQDTFSIDL